MCHWRCRSKNRWGISQSAFHQETIESCCATNWLAGGDLIHVRRLEIARAEKERLGHKRFGCRLFTAAVMASTELGLWVATQACRPPTGCR